MRELPSVQAAADETGLGRQICWEAAQTFGSRFIPVNFSSKKQDLGFALMNQLSMAEKRFPREEQDIAADYFALRKSFVGKKWVFAEGYNSHNPSSHCDIAWAGALASEAHLRRKSQAWAMVC
jgi:phage FluMu gp28-like protein